ncbi:hypothetical protein [Pedobacter nyackensis]|uniref:hypothetical protein n=1 Tax=Pedobacter nyackensis TaxID=475255 RepID=UPI0009FD739E|nr:hypothetical protein [Pedobacter nyackensis]
MRTTAKLKAEEPLPRPAYIQRLPKKKIVQERKKIRQLLRSMLPMEDEQRQLQEEQKLYHKPGKAH